LSANTILQVHDELVLECPTEEVFQTSKVVREVMENAYDLTVPLTTEARSGPNWGELTLVGDD
jgi:DNA polymerase-1